MLLNAVYALNLLDRGFDKEDLSCSADGNVCIDVFSIIYLFISLTLIVKIKLDLMCNTFNQVVDY